MKVIILIIGAVVAMFAGAAAYDIYAGPQLVVVEKKIEINKTSLGQVPEFSFETLDGEKLSITDLQGKIVIVNFWATWCPTCLTEFPDMLDAINELDGKIILLALSSDNNTGDIKRFIKKQNKKRKEILNSDFVYVSLDKKREITHDLFLTDRYPESIVIDANGNMIRKIVGGVDWHALEMKEYLEKLSSF